MNLAVTSCCRLRLRTSVASRLARVYMCTRLRKSRVGSTLHWTSRGKMRRREKWIWRVPKRSKVNSDEDLFCFPVGIVEIHPRYDGLKVPVACARFICHPIRFPACFCRTGRSFSPSNDETRSQWPKLRVVINRGRPLPAQQTFVVSQETSRGSPIQRRPSQHS